ncbi:MAG: hypothetical protein CML73_02965 [Rhodobiaceae bacterium]|nr:hypothetical protein [Rhodobiaceae bacterium]
MIKSLNVLAREVSRTWDTQPLDQRPDTIKRILDLRKKGVSLRIISLAVNLSRETVRQIVKQHARN